MKSAYEKMLSGELYDASDNELMLMRIKARELLLVYNQTMYDKNNRSGILGQLLAKKGVNIDIQSPFYCDYGKHIEVGDNFFANFNCIFLDCNYIRIGHNVSIGPAVQIYAASHPLHAAERIKGPELAFPVSIGNNVWIGGGSIICAGVEIGDNSTIGAGSVVVKNIPANVMAAGNPCRAIKNV